MVEFQGRRGIDAVTEALVKLALLEDLASYGDVTSEWTVPPQAEARARVVAREEAVVSGLPLAAAVMREVDPSCLFGEKAVEGQELAAGDVLAEIRGRARSVLAAERTMLNMLRHVCGVATQARLFSRAVEGTNAVVVDTRKTMPGLRFWEKRAVRAGGCENHRFGLFDMVLIKDNHVVAGGSIAAAVRAAKTRAPFSMKVEVEVQDEAGLREAVAAGADIVLLDNMEPETLRRCVEAARLLDPSVLLEASGRVTLENVAAIARTGVDLISSSALTAGAPPVDLALDFVVDTA
jgi:nicotinate-nucleotide pyrophosphorylase (carboxylating)